MSPHGSDKEIGIARWKPGPGRFGNTSAAPSGYRDVKAIGKVTGVVGVVEVAEVNPAVQPRRYVCTIRFG